MVSRNEVQIEIRNIEIDYCCNAGLLQQEGEEEGEESVEVVGLTHPA